MNAKDLALFRSCILSFMDNPLLWEVMVSILKRPPSGYGASRETPSLRLIFYYVSTYTKHHPTMTTGDKDVHQSYQQMLRIHTKHRFDPFCRKSRQSVAINGHAADTNVGQMVFFRWFIRNGILDKLYRDYHLVVAERMESQRLVRTKRQQQRKCTGKKVEVAARKAAVTKIDADTNIVPPQPPQSVVATSPLLAGYDATTDSNTRVVVSFNCNGGSEPPPDIRIAL